LAEANSAFTLALNLHIFRLSIWIMKSTPIAKAGIIIDFKIFIVPNEEKIFKLAT